MERRQDIRTHTSTKVPKPNPPSPVLFASSANGIAIAIVVFKQSNRFESIPLGNGVTVAFASLENTALLLYPSMLSAALLARKYCTICSGLTMGLLLVSYNAAVASVLVR